MDIIIPEKIWLGIVKNIPIGVNNGSGRGVAVPRPAGSQHQSAVGAISVPSLLYYHFRPWEVFYLKKIEMECFTEASKLCARASGGRC